MIHVVVSLHCVIILYTKYITVCGWVSQNKQKVAHKQKYLPLSFSTHIWLVLLQVVVKKCSNTERNKTYFWVTGEHKLVIGATWYALLKFLSFLCNVRQAATDTVCAASQWLQLFWWSEGLPHHRVCSAMWNEWLYCQTHSSLSEITCLFSQILSVSHE